MSTNLRSKRLGQVFSGRKVADLLVNLCNPSSDNTCLDPMCGSGDMLASLAKYGVSESNIFGFEIDPLCFQSYLHDFKDCNVINSDAFDPNLYSLFPHNWDLIITNPPYVSSQNQKIILNDIDLKSLDEVRENLLTIINSRIDLLDDDKACLCYVVSKISSRSDLSIFSWVLCMTLVKPGGYVGIVVSESWFNRDYSLPLKYAILSLFNIQSITVDLNSKWFSSAQVKTNLVVLKRVPFHQILDNNYQFPIYELPSSLIGDDGILDNLVLNGCRGFDVLANHSDPEKSEPMDFIKFSTPSWIINEVQRCKSLKLNFSPSIQSTLLPSELSNLLNGHVECFQPIQSCGIHIGQGFRSGANVFFYVNIVCESDNQLLVKSFSPDYLDEFHVPSCFISKAIHSESDISDRLKVSSSDSDIGILSINKVDVSDYPELSRYISYFENNDVLIKGSYKKVPTLSAVRTNIKRSDGEFVSNWYMLPDFKPRHKPPLFINRVNGKNVKCYCSDCSLVIDANFSTIWFDSDALDLFYFVALFNSSLFQYYLELTCTVMGGGALKVESTHLKALFIPIVDRATVVKLTALGKQLAHNYDGHIVDEIDCCLLKSIMCEDYLSSSVDDLKTRLLNKVQERLS